MISLRLWRALNHPPRNHPLFKYILLRTHREIPQPTNTFFLWMATFSGIGFCWTAIYDWMATILVLAVLCINTAYSMLWMNSITRTIVDEKEQRRFDLLAALPPGAFGTTWAMCTGSLHRRSSFVWVPFLIRVSSVIMLMTLVSALLITLFFISNDTLAAVAYDANFDVLPLIIAGIGLVIAFYIDHLYSMVTATIVGMLASIDVLYTYEARLRAILGFIAVQIFTYGVSAFVALGVMPVVLRFASVPQPGASVLQVMVTLIVFVVIRESSTRYLWAVAVRALNAEPRELELLISSGAT